MEPPPERPSLYVHLPFCVRKCRYCDFNSWAWAGQDLHRVVDALLLEAERRARGLCPPTVFVGGGTPTLLPASELARLLDGLHEISGFRDSSRETTVEANPESLDAERAAALREGGADRLSLGVQSLRKEVLEAYDRVHGPAEVLEAVRTARAAGFHRLNVDLIYAFPGQDPELWFQALAEVLALEPEHVSAYELSYEPGTSLTRLRDAGRWPEESEERRLFLFQETRRRLAEAGYGQYEVSNFARAGGACLHNLVYWRSGSWIGLGAGAAGSEGHQRRRNLADPEAWRRCVERGEDPVDEVEEPGPETLLFDRFLMGLRLPWEGVDLEAAQVATGLDPAAVFRPAWQRLQDEELLVVDAGRARATARGFLLLDSLLEALLPRQQV